MSLNDDIAWDKPAESSGGSMERWMEWKMIEVWMYGQKDEQRAHVFPCSATN